MDFLLQKETCDSNPSSMQRSYIDTMQLKQNDKVYSLVVS